MEKELKIPRIHFHFFIHADAQKFAVAEGVRPRPAIEAHVVSGGERFFTGSGERLIFAVEAVGQIGFVVAPAIRS